MDNLKFFQRMMLLCVGFGIAMIVFGISAWEVTIIFNIYLVGYYVVEEVRISHTMIERHHNDTSRRGKRP